MPLVFLYTPWKHQKTSAFLMFSGGIERDQWHEIGLVVSFPSLWSSFILRTLTSRVFSKRYCALMLKNMFRIFFYVPCKLWKRLNGKGLFVKFDMLPFQSSMKKLPLFCLIFKSCYFQLGIDEYFNLNQRCSVRKSVPRNFGKLTGKHLCQSLFFK